MSEHNLYCEADAEYWRAIRENRKTIDTVAIKRIQSPYAREMFWMLDGKQSSRGIISRSIMWHPKLGRIPRLYNRLKGARALDICSSYGVSSRELAQQHNRVDVVEFEDFQARIVTVNVNGWGYKDRINVRHTRDLNKIDYSAYDTVRFGVKEVEHYFWQFAEQFMQMKNICFEFNTNNVIVETLLNEGYYKGVGYTSSDIFTKHK